MSKLLDTPMSDGMKGKVKDSAPSGSVTNGEPGLPKRTPTPNGLDEVVRNAGTPKRQGGGE